MVFQKKLFWVLVAMTYWNAPVLRGAEIDFSHDIVPILRVHCIKCHGGDEREGEFSLNTRESFLKGGENGPAAASGNAANSLLIRLVTTQDKEKRMPPEGEPLSATEIKKLSDWIDQGAKWESGFTFAKNNYEPPLRPRRPTLPEAIQGRDHPVDRILDRSLKEYEVERPKRLDDAAFARRVWLDLNGLLPPAAELESFLKDTSNDKRKRLIDKLLDDKLLYAEHWLTFWNDLLRNDYGGTGFITGGRKQISQWLYRSLIDNKPYDQMAKELISPSAESSGFADGIRWRGTVSAGQTVEIQFAQSVGQSFLGINLKCASCHDSFIDRWTLDDAYGLAAIYSKVPLDIHRCDKPIGRQAKAVWLFPELGAVDPQANPQERLKQMANLMTHPENGRFTRTIVNRIWHRLMGRGIVEPVDAMQTRPWNEDLLDWLAVDFADHRYDLKHTMRVICNSEAYQSVAEVIEDSTDMGPYVYRGPRAKRMTAEQFVDTVWQLTEAAPKDYDAPFLRGDVTAEEASKVAIHGKWIWDRGETSQAPADQQIVLRKIVELDDQPKQAGAIATCDNSYELFINNKKVATGDLWNRVQSFLIHKQLKKGKNEILMVCKNGGTGPNPAGAFFEARIESDAGNWSSIQSDKTWEWTSANPDRNGKFKNDPSWSPAVEVVSSEVWMNSLQATIRRQLLVMMQSQQWMVRAALLKSDAFQRTLGRTNRDQIVTSRPNAWSTLEALDLNNAQVLDNYLNQGAKHLLEKSLPTKEAVVRSLFQRAFSRGPTSEELQIAIELLEGESLTISSLQDLLWSIVMLPEFQIVR